jgi:hypothetical protein
MAATLARAIVSFHVALIDLGQQPPVRAGIAAVRHDLVSNSKVVRAIWLMRSSAWRSR